jgi:hypothetical protein
MASEHETLHDYYKAANRAAEQHHTCEALLRITWTENAPNDIDVNTSMRKYLHQLVHDGRSLGDAVRAELVELRVDGSRQGDTRRRRMNSRESGDLMIG